MSVGVRQKDPAGVNNFTLNWADHLTALGGLTISSSDWTVPVGITEVSAGNTTTTTTIRLSGGTHGSNYEVVNHVVLSDGQEEERSLTIQVRQVEAGPSLDATDRSYAVATLSRWVQIDAAPTISQTDLETILDDHKRASTWTTATAYRPGDVILPTVRNGHRYRVTVGGTSGTAEPTWPTGDSYELSEGSSSPALKWIEDGPDYSNVYDLRSAAEECWALKERKAAQFMQAGDLGFNQVYQHCQEQRIAFGSVRIA